MAVMPQGAMQAGKPVRTAFMRLALLWIIGILAVAILYLLLARVMAPTLQEDMARIEIYAYRGWQSTGVRLEPNEVAVIRAKGNWLYTPGEWHDADGHRRYAAPNFYPMAGVRGGVLLGRVGEGMTQLVGSRAHVYASEGGMLYLRINDDILSDNEGSLQVTIEVLPAPEE